MSQYSYVLSADADQDLGDIFNYTADEFGFDQAVNYLTGIDRCLNGLCDNPKLCRERGEIRESLCSLSHESHVIFYRILKDHIRIVRILHGGRDLPKFL